MSVVNAMREHIVDFCRERLTDLVMVDFIADVRVINTAEFLLSPKDILADWVTAYDSDVLFFIMDLTHYCLAKEGVTLSRMNASFIVPMAETYSVFHNDPNVPEVMTGDYCPSFKYLEQLFLTSTWIMFLLIIKTIPLTELTGNMIAPKPEHTS